MYVRDKLTAKSDNKMKIVIKCLFFSTNLNWNETFKWLVAASVGKYINFGMKHKQNTQNT